MANYRGQDGTLTYATINIAELLSWSLDGVEVEMIDDTVKGDTVRTFKGGLGNGGTLTCRCYLDYATGQQDLIDDIIAATATSLAFVALADTSKTFTGSAIPQRFSINSPEGSALVDVTFVCKVTGAVAMAWA